MRKKELEKKSESFQDGYWDGFYWDARKERDTDYTAGYREGLKDGPQKSGFALDER